MCMKKNQIINFCHKPQQFFDQLLPKKKKESTCNHNQITAYVIKVATI